MKIIKGVALTAALLAGGAAAQAQNLGDIIKNTVEGIFTSSDITLKDITGSYRTDGPAVCFKSDNFLKKAGGVAAAAAAEAKIAPYYSQLGLNNATMTINGDGTFELGLKMLTLSGNITEGSEKGTFDFQFMAFNTIPLSTVKGYVEKSVGSVNVMFDATKLKTLLAGISKIVNIKSLNAINEILGMYDGICIGFKLKKTGDTSGSKTTSPSKPKNNGSSAGGSSDSTSKSGLDALRDILNRR